MTLIVSYLAPGFVLQVADRRLVDGDDKLVEDNETKMVVFNGHMIFGYTGLARLPMVRKELRRTDVWLADSLSNLGSAYFDEKMKLLAQFATDTFRRFRVASRNKRLAICACGWVYQGTGRLTPVRCLVSNWHNRDGARLPNARETFQVSLSTVKPTEPGKWIFDGQEPSADDTLAIVRRLRRLGTERVTGKVALALACQSIRKVARCNAAVGRNLHCVYMPREAVTVGSAVISSGQPSGHATKCLYLRDGDVIGEHRAPHVVAFGTQFIDARFGPAGRDGLVRLGSG